jgi:hypothetical protein
MNEYPCRGCGDRIPDPVDDAACSCDLCMALLMFDLECRARERNRSSGGHGAVTVEGVRIQSESARWVVLRMYRGCLIVLPRAQFKQSLRRGKCRVSRVDDAYPSHLDHGQSCVRVVPQEGCVKGARSSSRPGTTGCPSEKGPAHGPSAQSRGDVCGQAGVHDLRGTVSVG